MRVFSGVYWDRGGKQSNEDSLAFCQVDTAMGKAVLAIVCDGIGGLDCGELASGYMAEQAVKWFYKDFLDCMKKGESARNVRRSGLRMLHETNLELNRYAERGNLRLGTAVSILAATQTRYYLFHSGDTRIYRIKKHVKQLTRDHGRGAILYRCIGSFPWKRPDFAEGRVRRNMGFLVCSDGFRRRLEEGEIKNLFRPRDMQDEKRIEKFLRAAGQTVIERGETDNLSAVYFCYGKEK